MLEKFLFPPAAQYSFVGKLSGGERRRLYLLRVLMTAPNVLLLDEPTNDLDIPTLMALEEYLDDFPGALIVVSHDRYFLDRTIDRVFKFETGGRLREYPGDYSAYLEIRSRDEAEKTEVEQTKTALKQTKAVVNESDAPKKLSFKEKRELETLEADIAAAEKRQAEIETQLSVYASDAFKLNELFVEQQKLTAQLDRDLERWAELSERAEL
jgi:ATP-binding cassette subfamily F protein uup